MLHHHAVSDDARNCRRDRGCPQKEALLHTRCLRSRHGGGVSDDGDGAAAHN